MPGVPLRRARAASGRLRLASLLAAALALAPWAPPPAAADGPGQEPVLDADGGDPALEAYVQGLTEGLMRTHHVPGVVVVVFRDGQVVLARGYGVADVETGRPVDPFRTRFRVASNSKLIVATAVMQQVERGALDLDADVNDLLKGFSLPETYGEPVTLRRLLSHTAGFDDRFLYSTEPLEAAPMPLGEYLAEHMPPRVMPPDRVISYSNHGYALAGLLVEQAAGLPFAEVVRRDVLEPLGMRHSAFGLPRPVPADVARPYAWRDGRWVDLGYDRLRQAPAGDLVTTGWDMARFGLAHLQGGALGRARILTPASVRRMHETAFTHHPDLDGWTLGFAEETRRGRRALQHGGSWRGFGTQLTLVPGAKLGWFYSSNLDYHGAFMRAMEEGLWDRFFPGPVRRAPEPPSDFASRAGAYTGAYVPNRRVRGSFLKLGQLLQGARVSLQDDGSLRVAWPQAGREPVRLVEVGEVGEDRFVGTGRDAELDVAFGRDDAGRVEHLFLENIAYDRVPPVRDPRLHAVVAALAALLFLGTLAGWILAAVVRRLAGGRPSPLTRGARWIAGVVCALLGGALVGVAVQLADPDVWRLMEGPPETLRRLLWLPVLATPFALWLPVELFRAVRPGIPSPLARLHYAVLTLAALLVLAGALYWNLVPWRA